MSVAMTYWTLDTRQLVLRICREPCLIVLLFSKYLLPSSHFFRKVTLLEDRESVIHLRNLSLHPASNEEEGEDHMSDVFLMREQFSFYLALNWLFLGDTNRVMAEVGVQYAVDISSLPSLSPALFLLLSFPDSHEHGVHTVSLYLHHPHLLTAARL